MEIQSVALIGAGAVGSYFVWGLAEKPGIDFCVVAEGARLERLKRDGLTINGRRYAPAVRTPKEAVSSAGTIRGQAEERTGDEDAGVDLILIAVKYDALGEAARMAKEIAGAETTVLSVLNGVDSEEIVGATVGAEKMLYSLMRIQVWRENGEFRFEPEGTAGLFFGEKDRGERTERVRAVERLFEGTGVRANFVPDMQGEIWNKFASNISRNLPQAMLFVGYGAYLDSAHAAFLRDKLDEEVHAVAAARGIVIPPMSQNAQTAWQKVDRAARFSTLQDLDAGRHTEVEMFLGVLMRLAKEAGVAVPCCEFSYHFIKALEEKNDGKFDYSASRE